MLVRQNQGESAIADPAGHPAAGASGDAAEAEAASAIAALLSRYLALFSARDFTAALECYRLPFTWLFGPRPVTVATAEEFTALMTQSRDALATGGLAGSRLTSVTVRLLGRHAALATAEVARLRADGTELERVAGTYLVHHDGQGWRLVANAVHPPGAGVPGRGVAP